MMSAQTMESVGFGLASHVVEVVIFFFFQAEDGIRDKLVTGVQTCALPISLSKRTRHARPAPCAQGRRSAPLLSLAQQQFPPLVSRLARPHPALSALGDACRLDGVLSGRPHHAGDRKSVV